MNVQLLKRLRNGYYPTDFNWNSDKSILTPIPDEIPGDVSPDSAAQTVIVDEGLRDGLASAKIYPSVEDMTKYIETASALGITHMTVGIFPGLGTKLDATIKRVLKVMYEKFPQITPIILSLASDTSMTWTVECKQINPRLNALIFLGTSPSRILVEEWNKKEILKKLSFYISKAVHDYGITVIGSTENTTQTPPAYLKRIIETEVLAGASYFCIADTIGICRPVGTYRIVKFVRQIFKALHKPDIRIDWHGHDDLRNSVSNSLAAVSAGANRIHVVARGYGERAGNTSMEGVIINLASILTEHQVKLPWNLKKLSAVLSMYDGITKRKPPAHGPFGTNAFKTSLGIHTAAMHKAHLLSAQAARQDMGPLSKKLLLMSRQIYSALDPQDFGLNHTVTVSPLSGKHTVHLAYALLGYKDILPDKTVEKVLVVAQQLGRELSNEEFIRVVREEHS